MSASPPTALAGAEDPAPCKAELCGPKGRGWLMRWLPSRAHDNGMFLLFSNGVGIDDDEIRTGNSMILDPYGEIIAESRALGDAMVVADLDASLLPTSSGRRWLRARRPELYDSLTRPTGQELETQVRFGGEPPALHRRRCRTVARPGVGGERSRRGGNPDGLGARPAWHSPRKRNRRPPVVPDERLGEFAPVLRPAEAGHPLVPGIPLVRLLALVREGRVALALRERMRAASSCDFPSIPASPRVR